MRHSPEYMQFVSAALVLCLEAAQVHQDYIGLTHQGHQCRLPGAVKAIALVDTVPTVRVGGEVEFTEPFAHLRLRPDEAAGQASIEKGEQIVRVQRAAQQVGTRNQHGIAAEPPAFNDPVKQGLYPCILLKHPKHQQGGWRIARREPAPQHPACNGQPQPG